MGCLQAQAYSIIPLCRIETAIPTQYWVPNSAHYIYFTHTKNDDGVDVDDHNNDNGDDDDTFRFCCLIFSLLFFASSSYFPLLNIIIKSSLRRYSILNGNDGECRWLWQHNSRSGCGGNKCGQIFTYSYALGCVLHSWNVKMCIVCSCEPAIDSIIKCHLHQIIAIG